MELEEYSYEFMPIYQNNFIDPSFFNWDASYGYTFQNALGVHFYESYDYYAQYFYNSYYSNRINESTGYSSNDDRSLNENENEQIDNSSLLMLFQNFKDILIPEKKKIFLCKKGKRFRENGNQNQKNKRCFRLDDERTNYVRQAINYYLNEEILDEIKEKDKKAKLKKFPEKFIAKVALVSNKKYLDKKLISLYEESKLYDKINKQKKSKTRSKIKNFITLDEIKEKSGVKKILEKTFKELANEYLESKKFKDYCQTLNSIEGIEKAKMLKHCGNYFADKGTKFQVLK